MKKLNETSLRVGDIILTTTTQAVSKAVRVATRSDISHAMVYVQGYSVIDATGEGVQARNTQRLFFEEDCSIYVLRYKDGLSDEQAQRICMNVRSNVGTEYSTKEAIQTTLGGAKKWTKKQFCSRLVAQSYAQAGIPLVTDPNFCSPDDIKNSPLLEEVQNPTIAISAEEAARWEGGARSDTTSSMRAAINEVLEGARTKDRNIQNFDDLNTHLIQHPDHDEFICCLLDESGYMSVWKIEVEKNPWHYDANLMRDLSAPHRDIENYCWGVLSDDQSGLNRFIVNRGGYSQLFDRYGLSAFSLLRDLYQHLATLHQKRVQAATEWLVSHKLLELEKEPYLLPHTKEWFAALEKWDPRQVHMTRAAIKVAGREDICSICGDDPAEDYCLPESHRPPSGVFTLRLCVDCLEIRKMRGEPYEPLSSN